MKGTSTICVKILINISEERNADHWKTMQKRHIFWRIISSCLGFDLFRPISGKLIRNGSEKLIQKSLNNIFRISRKSPLKRCVKIICFSGQKLFPSNLISWNSGEARFWRTKTGTERYWENDHRGEGVNHRFLQIP